jgi:quinol-cytochrome oxidoreductase complex cytochrome b subunit
VGNGSDSTEITNFLHIHTVFLPALLLVFLALKVYMYEVHGPSYVPAYGKPRKGKIYTWFPKIFLYATVLFSVYIAILVATSSLVPLVLPPAFSPATAGQYIVQPDWYLLFVYQILKFQMFEGSGAIYAITALVIFFVLLFLLPFYDRSKRRSMSQRPVFVTIGTMGAAEFVTLTVWGYLTPGQVIPDWQALLVLGGVAAATAIVLWFIYRLRRRVKTAAMSLAGNVPTAPVAKALRGRQSRMKHVTQSLFSSFTAVFVFLLVTASASLASMVNLTSNLAVPESVALAIVFVCSLFGMCSMLRKYVLAYERETGTG